MRKIQWRILQGILQDFPIPEYIYGFETGKSIPVMSRIHVDKDFVISLDIKNFFPSITERLVNQIFRKAGMGEAPAKLLSELCTYKFFVPQGALTSPKISNIVAASTFGPEIHEMCMRLGLTLSIYADDITISGNNQPTEAGDPAQTYNFGEIISDVTTAVRKYGFNINREKTKVMRPFQRQWVCGAVVNSQVNLVNFERLKLRAIVHNCETNGVEVEAQKSGLDTLTFVRKYAGKLNWFYQLNPEKARPLCQRFKKITGPLVKMHPAFDIDPLAYSSSIEDLSSNLNVGDIPF